MTKDADVIKATSHPGKPGKTLFTWWKDVKPAGHCNACDQSTDKYDRDHLPGKEDYLYWVQSRISAKHNKGKPIPAGKECYPCYFVRRKHFNAIKPEQLAEKRKQNPKIDARFWKNVPLL